MGNYLNYYLEIFLPPPSLKRFSVLPFRQTCLNILIGIFSADFLLHRGRFHQKLASLVRAFLSTG